jgi:mannose-6-phosphate isomerase-like protein (cupin superfamily)
MSAYSIVDLKEEVADSLGERAPGIEGRFARKQLDSEHLGISYLRYSPGVRSPSAHSHREQEEAYVVISGAGHVRLDDEITSSAAGMSFASTPQRCGRSKPETTDSS